MQRKKNEKNQFFSVDLKQIFFVVIIIKNRKKELSNSRMINFFFPTIVQKFFSFFKQFKLINY